MMRALLAVVLLALVAAAPARDWRTVGVQSAAGSYVVGNPQAKVRLIEYASYVCPHCGHFSRESAPTLEAKMIASGSLSYEIRPLVVDQIDLTAAVAARCAGPDGFLKVTQALFAAQDDWYWRARSFLQANEQRIASYPAPDRLAALATGSGIADVATANGVPVARVAQCYADRALVERVVAISADAMKVAQGTPTFVLNGRRIVGVDWAKLEPMLRAAGAK